GAETVNFTSIENLTGNTGADRFVLDFNLGDPADLTDPTTPAVILGVAKGAGGNDEFAINASKTGTLQGGAGNDQFTLGGNVAVASLNGGTGSDELVATTTGTLFDLSATNAGTAAQRLASGAETVNFTSIENLTGNTGADRFVLDFNLGDPADLTDPTTPAVILGAALGKGGVDEFTISHDQTGTIDGGDDGDKFAIDASQTGTLQGGAGNDQFTLGGNVAVASLNGGTGSDELVATTTGTLFDLSATNAGTAAQRLASGAETVNFTSIENL